MRKKINLLMLCLAIGVMMSSCVSKKKWTELLNDKDALAQTLTETNQKVKMLEGQVADLETLKTNLEGELATASSEREKLSMELGKIKGDLQAKSDELAMAKKSVEAAESQNKMMKGEIKTAFSPYAQSGLSLTEKRGKVYVALAEPVLFRSGSTRVNRKNYDNLKNLAEILMNNPNMTILVEGHSDNAKMKSGVGYSDNFDISFKRALSVVSKLKRYGVAPNQLSVVGKGDVEPAVMVDPSSSEARTQNRRVEFLVVPKAGGIFKMNKV